MSKRILRGQYHIVGIDGSWRRGTMVAGQRIKLAEGEYVKDIEVLTPLMLTRDGLPVWIFTQPGQWMTFDPFALAMTFDVRRAPSR